MNTPDPRRTRPQQRPHIDDEVQVRLWLKLREELTELNARLEYLRLLAKMGVRRID